MSTRPAYCVSCVCGKHMFDTPILNYIENIFHNLCYWFNSLPKRNNLSWNSPLKRCRGAIRSFDFSTMDVSGALKYHGRWVYIHSFIFCDWHAGLLSKKKLTNDLCNIYLHNQYLWQFPPGRWLMLHPPPIQQPPPPPRALHLPVHRAESRWSRSRNSMCASVYAAVSIPAPATVDSHWVWIVAGYAHRSTGAEHW